MLETRIAFMPRRSGLAAGALLHRYALGALASHPVRRPSLPAHVDPWPTVGRAQIQRLALSAQLLPREEEP